MFFVILDLLMVGIFWISLLALCLGTGDAQWLFNFVVSGLAVTRIVKTRRVGR